MKADKAQIPIPRQELREFCQRNRVRRLALFGSVLRDDFGPESDVDVLIEFQPETRMGLQFFALEAELSQLLGRKVDLNTLAFLEPSIRQRVIASAQVEYERD